VQLHEERHYFKEGLLGKSKLAQHAYEEGYSVTWDEATAHIGNARSQNVW
jgi:hypothetical protein